jgi:hypothetical protein
MGTSGIKVLSLPAIVAWTYVLDVHTSNFYNKI